IPLANGLMFVAKGFGAMFAVLVLGSILLNSGFQAALLVQLPVLFLIMLVPLFVLEKEGDKFLPWSKGLATSTDASDDEVMKFSEIISGFKLAVSDPAPRWALLLCTIMWIGGGMGTGMGIIDFQWEFLFVDELGWDAQDYLDTKALPVFLSTMAGFLVGGFLGSKFGSQRVLLSAVGLGTVMTIVWSASRSNWSDQSFMTGIWLLWTLIWAIVGANLLALLMSVTTKELGGTQFSIYMTLINVGAFAGNALSPRVLDMVDGSYANLFLVGAAFQGLVFLVLLGMGSRLQSTSDSPPESVVISSSAGADTESE
ncbi:MAG: MFS transporter, partial [Candidatus Thermoplasmatota archaeon]|nr:MFS transporter [Candidatus Thermoplasmatota archaeon]